MLQAMNTGHDGSLTTVHANSPRDAISRLEVMVSMANSNMQVNSIRQQIASAVHMLVQASRFSDGSRRVTGITEVTGMEGSIITLQDLFVFEKRGGSWVVVQGHLSEPIYDNDLARAVFGTAQASDLQREPLRITCDDGRR